MRQFAVRMVSLAICVSFCLCPWGRDGSLRADETERFLREAPAQWSAYAKRLSRLQGRIEEKFVYNGQVIEQAVFEVKQNAQCAMYTLRRTAAELPSHRVRGEFVAAFNGRYAFTLARSAADQPWLVEGIQEGTAWPVLDVHPGRGGASATGPVIDTLFQRVNRCAWLMGSPIPTSGVEPGVPLTGATGFRVLAATVTGPGRLQVRFERRNSREEVLQHGTLVVDPDHYYCLCGMDWELRDPNRPRQSRVVIEYSVSDHGLPIPVLLRLGGDGVGTVEVRYELHEAGQLPADNEFTLAAFGLPEPNLRNTNWLLWGCLIGVPIIALVCAWRFLSRRHTRGRTR